MESLKWDASCELVFEMLTTKLNEAPALTMIDPSQPLLLHTEALSNDCRYNHQGAFNVHEKNYGIPKLEEDVIIWAVKKNRYYLLV